MKKFLYNAVFVFVMLGALALTIINLLPYVNKLFSMEAVQIFLGVLCFIGGGIAASLLSVLLHEIGHMFIGLFTSFKTISFRLFNFGKRYKSRNKGRSERTFSYGSCSLVSTKDEKLKSRFLAVTAGGIIASLLVFGGYLALNVLLLNVNVFVYLALSTGMLISLYLFLSVLLPAQIEGTHTDGAIVCGLTKDEDYTTVLLSILAVQTELYKGKTPSEIDRELYFNVPLLSDDHSSMQSLYALRKLYYLDSADYEKAAQTDKRLMHFYDAMTEDDSDNLRLDIVFDLVKAEEYKKAKGLFAAIKDGIKENITSCRIMAYYFFYAENDEKRAAEYVKKAKTEKGKLFKGIELMENKLVKNLEKNFNGTTDDI